MPKAKIATDAHATIAFVDEDHVMTANATEFAIWQASTGKRTGGGTRLALAFKDEDVARPPHLRGTGESRARVTPRS